MKIPGGTLTAKLFRIVMESERWKLFGPQENEKNVTGILNRGNPACLIIFVASGDKRRLSCAAYVIVRTLMEIFLPWNF